MASFSIAICTRNRADHLRRCLNGLVAQDFDHRPPLLVVDNGSTDQTSAVLADFTGALDPVVLVENRVGLSHARNAALARTETDYLVFLDDDAIPLPYWCSAIDAGIETWQPDIFGGPYVPHYLTPKPGWFKDSLGSAHVDISEGLAAPRYCFSGGNMGWRTSILRELGGFDTSLGMVDGTLRLGEETALQMRLWDERPTLRRLKLPRMLMSHYVPPEKMKLSYIWRRSFTYGRQLGQINPSDPLWQDASFTRTLWACRMGMPLAVRFGRDALTGSDAWKTYAADWMGRFGVHFGALYERRGTVMNRLSVEPR